MTTQKTISIVIPALNEAPAIQQVIREVPSERLKRLGYTTQILVVDNGSTDGTGDLAREAGAQVISELARGYGRAYKTGLKNACGEIIVCVDGDLSYPLGELPQLVAKMDAEGLDFLTTNRLGGADLGSIPWLNRIGNVVLTTLIRLLFGVPLKDSQSGMWIICKHLLERITPESDGMPFSQELKIKAVRSTKAWKQVPIRYRKRVGKVELNPFRDGLKNLIHLVKLRLSS